MMRMMGVKGCQVHEVKVGHGAGHLDLGFHGEGVGGSIEYEAAAQVQGSAGRLPVLTAPVHRVAKHG